MKVLRIPLKVHLSDVDHAGIVYYPNIFQYLNVALEEFFGRQVGVDYPTLVLEHRIGLPTVHLETDFRHPMRFGDKFDVEIAVEKVGKTSIVFAYAIRNAGTEEVAVKGRKVTVCLDLDQFKKTHIPQWLREKLTVLQEDPE
jgi:4-hydroxybenzoyl-CoA thioesterase